MDFFQSFSNKLFFYSISMPYKYVFLIVEMFLKISFTFFYFCNCLFFCSFRFHCNWNFDPLFVSVIFFIAVFKYFIDLY